MPERIFEREGGVEVFDQGDAHARHLLDRAGNVAVVVAAVDGAGDSQVLVVLSTPKNESERIFLLAFLNEVGGTLVNRADMLMELEFGDDGGPEG